jgi:hypothetical protein
MMTRVMGLLALLLATGCAFEQGQADDQTVAAPAARTTSAGGGAQAPRVETEKLQQGPTLPVETFAADPCDPDPQPWKPNCPTTPTGSKDVQRSPFWR